MLAQDSWSIESYPDESGFQLKAEGIINGTQLNFEEWAGIGVYKSPFL